MLTISVITVNYNNVEGLKKTISSVVSQSYPSVEYIVIDGGSTDGSVQLIESYASKISFWVSEKDKGIYNAMNKGIKATTGTYLLFLNSGDYFSKSDVIERLLKNFNKEADLIYGNLDRIFPDGLTDTVNMPATITVETMIKSTLCHPVTLIKRSLFEKYGLYDESLKIVADWAFFLKVIVLGNAKCQYKDISVAVFSMDGLSSKLSNEPIIARERQWVLDNYLSPTFREFFKAKQDLEYYYKKYRLAFVNRNFQKIKKCFNLLISIVQPVVKKLDLEIKSFASRKVLNDYKERYAKECYSTPIIINNRNHFSYLRKLIASLEQRGYTNINIIDNDSDYSPLLDYYNQIPYRVFLLNQNVGYCALWDTYVFQEFKDQYYVYTDSDLEIIQECPNDFMVVMHYLLNKYKEIGKVGFSLLTNDLPDYYQNKKEVQEWEAKFQRNKIEDLAYLADIDTTFALYRPNSYGSANILSGIRTSFPYCARHLPWYENTINLTEEQKYYYKNAKTSSHWSRKVIVDNI